tara:strand:+ start:29 stop:250 length:222 start_codon:yes stop_codon:yes gene_type:complete
VNVGDLVRYRDNAFMGETSPADWGTGIVLGVNKNYWGDTEFHVVWHSVKSKYKCPRRETREEKDKLIIVSGRK